MDIQHINPFITLLLGSAFTIIVQQILLAVGWFAKNKREDNLRWSKQKREAYINFYHEIQEAHNVLWILKKTKNTLADKQIEILTTAREKVSNARSEISLIGSEKVTLAADHLYIFVAKKVNKLIEDRRVKSANYGVKTYQKLIKDFKAAARKDLRA